jgi:hypothetical protein
MVGDALESRKGGGGRFERDGGFADEADGHVRMGDDVEVEGSGQITGGNQDGEPRCPIGGGYGDGARSLRQWIRGETDGLIHGAIVQCDENCMSAKPVPQHEMHGIHPFRRSIAIGRIGLSHHAVRSYLSSDDRASTA